MCPLLVVFRYKHLKAIKDCTWCMDETGGIWLKHCKTVVYMGHHRFLRADHAYQKNKKVFDGTIMKRRAPNIHSGEHMFRMVKDFKVILGKGKGVESKKTKKMRKNAKKSTENNDNKTSGLFKNDQYFGTYYIGRLDGPSCN
jgi:hypothetical protein